MPIDWFTVAAQAVNFLILLWLLKRFLYRPVLDAMDARERRIAGDFQEAARRMKESEIEREQARRQAAGLEAGRRQALTRIETEAAASKKQLEAAARTEGEAIQARWRESLVREQAAFQAELAVRVQREVLDIARKVLADLADSPVEDQIVTAFITRLRQLSAEERLPFNRGGRQNAASNLSVRTGLALSPGSRARLQAAVEEVFPQAPPPAFELRPEIVAGVEIANDGHIISWTVADYLAALERGVAEIVRRDETINASES